MVMTSRILLALSLAAAAAVQPTIKASPPVVRTPSPRASLLTNVGAGIFAASGALAWIAPAASLGNYGLPMTDASALSTMRTIGCWRLCSSAVLLAGKRGPAYAAGFGLLSASLATMANVANWDTLDRPISNQLPGIFILALLGKLTLEGTVGGRIAAGIYLVMGGLIWADPTSTVRDVYAIPTSVSALGKSMLSLSGGAIVSTGIFLSCLVGGLALPKAVAAAFAADALFALKWALTEATALGATKAGGLIWAVSSALVGALALK